MDRMTSVERVRNLLNRKPVDRIGLYEHFWGDTIKDWCDKGHIKEGESLEDHFGYDFQCVGPLNLMADLDFEPVIVEENEETLLVRDGNGALLRRYKTHDTTPEHVDFLVKDRAGWEEYIKPHLTPDRRRINFDAYRQTRAVALERQRFFTCYAVNVFELIHPVCGHEYMLMGMAIDPDWIKDMVDSYAQLTIDLMETLFSEEGYPDGIWFFDDMGFKQRPFFSLDMYREIIQPGHQKTIDYAHSKDIQVIMHSCGYIAPLVPGLLEAGIDCLQVIEVKAGMDLIDLYKKYGDRLTLFGGMDVRTLYTNDRAVIDRELESKIPIVKGNYGYLLHSDHSIPNQVEYANYRYFIERGLALGQYNGVG